jgi:peptide/nickel transport system substrate-binding protein
MILFLGCIVSDEERRVINAIGDFPVGLDPAKDHGISASHIIGNLYESLVCLHSDQYTIIEGLADYWQIFDDQMTYQFHLKEGIRFHDGSSLTARSVAYSFQRQLELSPTSPLLNMIEKITALDSFTLEIRLRHVYAPFLYALTASTGLKAISQEALDTYGDEIGSYPCGTGPMKLKEWKQNDCISIEPFSQNLSQKPDVIEVIFKYYRDYFDGEQSLRKGDSDIKASIAGYSIDRLKWQGLINYTIGESLSTVFLGFNTKDEILSNLKVRKAILSSIDIRDLVHNVLRGNSLVASGPLPPVFNIGSVSSQDKYDPEAARKFFEEAGYRQPLRLRFFYLDLYRARNTGFEMLERGLEKIGIELDKVPFYSWEALNAACRSDSAQLSWMVWEADMLGDPENFLYSLFHSQSHYNFVQYHSESVDSLLELSRGESLRESRNLLYQEIIRQILRDTPAVWLYHPIPIYAYNQKKIDFLPVDPYNIIQYNLIRLNR